jgi:dolichol-phosphate mannosyltransferase
VADPKTLIVIPTYNERDNVTPLWQGLAALGLDADVVFIDDGSPDGTGEILDGLAAANPRLKIIHRPGKLGIGTAHQAGIAYAYDHNYGILTTMDADFTHSPDNIPLLMQRLGDSDVAVGSRYIQNHSLAGWRLWRKFLTGLAHVLTTWLLDLKYDSTGAFRIYRLDRIPREIFLLVKSSGYSFFFESLHLLHFNKFKIVEMPICLPPRTAGLSKMSYGDIFKSLEMLLTTFLKRIFMRNSFRLQPGHTMKECEPTHGRL